MVTHSPLTREAQAHLEIGRTTVARGTVAFLVIFFLAATSAVPLLEIASGSDTDRPWAHLARIPAATEARVAEARSAGLEAWSQIVAGNRAVLERLHTFEEALEDESRLGRLLRPPAQLFMSAWLGAGNERAYVGRDRWLFYRPDVEYVAGPPFLDPAALKRRISVASEWTTPPQPDPRTAILAFKRHLDARGISLVVVPTPLKPTIHPERLGPGYDGESAPVQNPSYASFVEDLKRGGVVVFDAPRTVAGAVRASQASQYLATDTHWRPEAMEAVAEELAAFVRSRRLLPDVPAAGYQAAPREVRHLGDIAAMLDLPARQTLYAPEPVVVRRILTADGAPWQPSRSADVLVLGDSFSNIYSLPSMGWGDSAGFVEQIGYVLQRPIDRIVQNDQGAHATRALLRRAGAERLAGKRIVIWQFAARELAIGDWRLLE